MVMGALSPRTRNAQVALYQNGDVDHLVATDAIGMGLNLDIYHVAFSGLVKFDGRRHRHLNSNELAQIAGRAGRFTTDGTFGVTGEAPPLDHEEVEAIENHRFRPLARLQWRSSVLEFGTPERLVASLEAPAGHPDLQRAREADDLATLKELSGIPEVRDRLRTAPDVRLLWDVCQIPDFRKVTLAEHASLCVRLFRFLQGGGGIPTDWLARQIARIDRTDGDIDALSKRLAYIRTWTYVAQRRAWVDDADHWRDETRAVEDRLSDALHVQLTQRFVDRRTSVLMRRLKQRESLVATVTENGEVRVDDQFVGRLEGFRFRLDPSADADQARTLRAAGVAALAPALSLLSDKFYNAPDTEIDVTEQGGLMWGEHAVGKLVAGADPLNPQVQPFVDEDASPEVGEKVKRRLGHWIDRRIAALFQPLIGLRDDETLTGMARGIAFRLVEALGVVPRSEIAEDVKALDQESRASLRKHGVRFGQYTVFLPLLLKPAPTRLRLVLWSLAEGLDVFPKSPPPGLVTVAAVPDAPPGYYPRAGYRLAGERAIRIDMLERLADMIRALDARAGFEASPEMLSITGLGLEPFAKLMQGMGYQATEGARPKRRPQPATPEPSDPAPPAEPATAGEPEPDAPQPDIPAPDQPDLPFPQPTEKSAGPARSRRPRRAAGGNPGHALRPAAAEELPPPQPGRGRHPDARADHGTARGGAGDRGVLRLHPRPAAPPRAPGAGPNGKNIRGQAPRPASRGGRDQPSHEPDGRKGKPRPATGLGSAKPGPQREDKPAVQARPPRQEKPIDPDNPFAALMALKLRS